MTPNFLSSFFIFGVWCHLPINNQVVNLKLVVASLGSKKKGFFGRRKFTRLLFIANLVIASLSLRRALNTCARCLRRHAALLAT